MKPSEKLSRIPFSKIREIFTRVNELKAQGKDIISLGIGEPDFDTPANINEAMIQATRDGQTHYSANKGILPLRQAICDKYQQEFQMTYDPEEVIVTVGVAEGVFIALSAFLDPGDEVLIPDPSWLNYTHVPTMNGAIPVGYPLHEEAEYEPRISDLEELISERTKALVILDPSNPTGTAFSEDTVRQLAEFAVRHDLLVISDEIYEKITYDRPHHCIAAYLGMRERTILLNGMSKCYAMTGWRVGYLLADASLIPPLAKFHAYLVTNVPTMLQYGALEALQGPQESVTQMVSEFQRRRNYLTAAINDIPGLHTVQPTGGFYHFVNVSQTGMTGDTFTSFLLENAGGAVVPGTAVGKSPVDFVRISYATSFELLEEAMRRIRQALMNSTTEA